MFCAAAFDALQKCEFYDAYTLQGIKLEIQKHLICMGEKERAKKANNQRKQFYALNRKRNRK